MPDSRGQLGTALGAGAGRAATYVIAASVIVFCATLALVLSPRLRAIAGIQPAVGGYAVGDYVDVPFDRATVPRGGAAVFVRASCPACEQAAPNLQQFIRTASDPRSVFVVIGSAAREQDQQFARATGADADRILIVDFSTLRLARIPTVLVFDRTGRITFVRSGALSAEDFAAARRMLDTISTP
jgi:hypothetical protein